ncbi:hypothetical protein CKAH01_06395 [Colletotrichum kahawae]|uniref:Uncharacterized protein n=1 Tax=Colletotrichum kahawae TaxID=34407 RepID=A0AAD9YA74_COLKA|nr:hypothetical protein CKAH01_06395 [Colletotrichum kahawae]
MTDVGARYQSVLITPYSTLSSSSIINRTACPQNSTRQCQNPRRPWKKKVADRLAKREAGVHTLADPQKGLSLRGSISLLSLESSIIPILVLGSPGLQK